MYTLWLRKKPEKKLWYKSATTYNYKVCHKKVDRQLMAITLSKPNRVSKFFHPLNISHHTQSILPRTTCGKLKVKFATNYKHHVWLNETYLVTRFGRQCSCAKRPANISSVCQRCAAATDIQLEPVEANPVPPGWGPHVCLGPHVTWSCTCLLYTSPSPRD